MSFSSYNDEQYQFDLSYHTGYTPAIQIICVIGEKQLAQAIELGNMLPC